MESLNETANLPDLHEPVTHDTLLDNWAALTLPQRLEQFKALPRLEAEELFLNLSPADQAELYVEVPALEKRSWIRLLAPDQIADLLQAMSEELRTEAISLLDPQTRWEVTALLAYAEDDAGGLMNSRYARVRPDMSVEEAIRYLRVQTRAQVETINYAYVLDPTQRLLGVASLRQLFMSSPEKKVRDIMQTDMVTAPEDMDQEHLSMLFAKHDLLAIPVTDKQGRMKGIVTVDDIVGVVQAEATEDIQKMGGTSVLEAPYLKTSLRLMLRKRAGWLLVLFIGEMFTATAMGYYENELARAIVLALFIPLIIASGGNSGSQASTLIIRALALGHVRGRDWWRVLWRESLVGLGLGCILGFIGLLRVLLWPNKAQVYGEHFVLISLTVAFSLVGVVLWGALSGAMLPFLLRRLGADPAVASAPFVATLVDVTGLVLYFSLANAFLGGILL